MNSISAAIESVCRATGSQNVVPLHEPDFTGTKAWEYVKDCLDTGWVSTAGHWVSRFEEKLADCTGSPYVIAVVNGTAALRLALHLVGVQHDEEVLIPSLSFVATANAVSHLGAHPHFIDIEPDSLGMCPIALQQRLLQIAVREGGQLINRQTRRKLAAVLPVHVFGNPADVIHLKEIADYWGLPLIEDAAEALGSHVNGTHCGLYGDIGCISFNGNKLLTTGGGGALLTSNSVLAERARHLSTTAKKPHAWEFIHDEVAWNDRLPNINAALGVAQLEQLAMRLAVKAHLARQYETAFSQFDHLKIIKERPGSSSNHWLVTVRFTDQNVVSASQRRLEVLRECHSRGLLLRPVWQPLHRLPMYRHNPQGDLASTDHQAPRLLNLPSSPQLSAEWKP